MGVDLHGLETIRTSGEYVVAGNKSDCYIKTSNISSFVDEPYDYIALTYVSAGNGAGEIETVTYKNGGSGGTTVATLTITYNGDNKIETITKS
jgi:hypothetical protein